MGRAPFCRSRMATDEVATRPTQARLAFASLRAFVNWWLAPTSRHRGVETRLQRNAPPQIGRYPDNKVRRTATGPPRCKEPNYSSSKVQPRALLRIATRLAHGQHVCLQLLEQVDQVLRTVLELEPGLQSDRRA